MLGTGNARFLGWSHWQRAGQLSSGWLQRPGPSMCRSTFLPRRSTSSSLKRWSNHFRPRCVSRSMHLALRQLSRHASRTPCYAKTQRQVIGSAVAAGLLSAEEGGNHYIHPLFREFLLRDRGALESSEAVDDARLVAEALAHDGEWDAAFDVARRAALTDVIAGLFEAAGPELLRAGRTASLKAWAKQANDLAITSPHIDLVAAEVAFRAGEPAAAEALALRAARDSMQASTTQRAFVRAARAATFDDRPHVGADHATRACELARDDDSLRAALYARFLAEVELENPEATRYLDEFEATALSVDDMLRLGGGRLFHAHRLGPLYPCIDETRLT